MIEIKALFQFVLTKLLFFEINTKILLTNIKSSLKFMVSHSTIIKIDIYE